MATKFAIRLHNRYTILKAKAKGLRLGSNSSSSSSSTNGGQKQCLWCRILRRKSSEPFMKNADIHEWMSSDETLIDHQPEMQVIQDLSGNFNPEEKFLFREGAVSRLSVRSNAPSSVYSSDDTCVDSDDKNNNNNSDDDNDWSSSVCSIGEEGEEETFYDAEDGLPEPTRDMVPLPSTYSPFASDLPSLPSAYCSLCAF
ncbi:hypothetical protein COL5a_005303 [Colletotrichum fioriniae]|uniref:uncharacterized protein n=1 Tax=Colletotrichum fioriniae TaxID=710243 RepID=UPI0023007030|nr:uncharacterized protein COL516b_006059 [Colletotrichum fioriniae]KAJ0304169.1 hypothetical protein COL516b_006059 [Colletotrichum fioriniae]KAJ0328099.1 hypothetical protein COL5a_005303 [Colletotrichum fioriniae]KAJ3950630.1 hypothetical protein N0V96_001780 [Colletotrichum fioriniae]